MICSQAGPTVNQTSNSVVWMYRSTADGNQQAHQNAGLYGPIIVARRGFGDADGKANDVDREFVTVFFVSAACLGHLLVRLTSSWPECTFWLQMVWYPTATPAELTSIHLLGQVRFIYSAVQIEHIKKMRHILRRFYF